MDLEGQTGRLKGKTKQPLGLGITRAHQKEELPLKFLRRRGRLETILMNVDDNPTRKKNSALKKWEYSLFGKKKWS